MKTLHRTYARLVGFFWMPCPICGTWFGGHQWRARGGHIDSVPCRQDPSSFGEAICPSCTRHGEGCVRWRAYGEERHPLGCSRMAAA